MDCAAQACYFKHLIDVIEQCEYSQSFFALLHIAAGNRYKKKFSFSSANDTQETAVKSLQDMGMSFKVNKVSSTCWPAMSCPKY